MKSTSDFCAAGLENLVNAHRNSYHGTRSLCFTSGSTVEHTAKGKWIMTARHTMLALLWVSLVNPLSACSHAGLFALPAAPEPATALSAAVSTAQISRQRVVVRFLNQLPNGERVALVPDALESLSFDGQFSLDRSAFPANQGLAQEFPFIEAGEHTIELLFRGQTERVRLPLVVDQTAVDTLQVLVILSFEPGSNRVRDVLVAYDQDLNGVPDTDQRIYRSSNGHSYLSYYPDGRVEEWLSPLSRPEQDVMTPKADAPLPPGSERDTSLRERAPIPQADPGEQRPPPVDVPPIPVPQPMPLPVPEL